MSSPRAKSDRLLVPEPVGPSFASWIVGYPPAAGGNPAIVGSTADHDGDGLGNLREYGLARAPNVRKPAPVPESMTVGGSQNPALTFQRVTGGNVVAEISDDLVTWSSAAGALVRVGTAEPDAAGLNETVTFRSTAPLAAKPRQFVRVRITSP